MKNMDRSRTSCSFACVSGCGAPSAQLMWAEDRRPVRTGAVLVCGHPGDAEHRQQFGESFVKIYRGLAEHQGFPAEDVAAYFGVNTGNGEPPAFPVRGPAAVLRLSTAAARSEGEVRTNDTVWVVAMGHAHFDGRRALLKPAGSRHAAGRLRPAVPRVLSVASRCFLLLRRPAGGISSSRSHRPAAS